MTEKKTVEVSIGDKFSIEAHGSAVDKFIENYEAIKNISEQLSIPRLIASTDEDIIKNVLQTLVDGNCSRRPSFHIIQDGDNTNAK